jgi:uncharacterized membrane protein YfcA
VIPGTFLLKTGNDTLLKAILGLIIIGIAIEMYTRKPSTDEEKKTNPIFLILIGVISGVMAGMYGIGALLIAYISRTTNGKSQFRANTCCIFLVDNIFRLCLYLYTGILNKEVLLLALLLSPAVIIGMILGVKVDSCMDEQSVKKSVVGLLIVSGTILFLRSVIG